MNILIGCVVRVDTRREAIRLLQNNREFGGVIWEDPIEDLPELTVEQRIILSQSHVTWHHKTGMSFVYGNHERVSLPPEEEMEELTPYFDMARRDVYAANEFKSDIDRRKHWFLMGEGNDTQHHTDWKARNIWLHRHLSRSGLKVIFPTGNQKALELKVGPHPNRIIRAESLRAAFESGALSSTELRPHENIAFNENMLHISSADKDRTRTTVNGYAR